MAEAAYNPWRELRMGIAAVLADRQWPLKVAIGGGLMLTLLGVIFPQGFLIEHLDNSRRGFRTPLPSWRQWGDKAIMGMMASVLDFVYFAMPLLLTAGIMLCAILPLLFNVGDAPGWSNWILGGLLGAVMLVGFVLSLSPLAKVRFAKDGEMEQSLGRPALRRAVSPLTRDLYWRTRLASLPLYLPAAAAAAALIALIQRSAAPAWQILLAGWLLGSAVFWAWLVVGQMYLAASEIAEDRELDARLAARKQAINNE